MSDLSQTGSLEGLNDALSSLGILPLGNAAPVESPDALSRRRRAFFGAKKVPSLSLVLSAGRMASCGDDGAPGLSG